MGEGILPLFHLFCNTKLMYLTAYKTVMKTIFFTLILMLIITQNQAQNFYASNQLLRTIDGTSVEVNEVLSSQGTILVFWESHNPKCSNNLENLQESWVEQVKALGVNLVAICIDNPGQWTKIKPYVSGKGWEFDTYVDTNGDLKRALGITTTPYTILLDGDQNIKCRYPGYCSGDEAQICEKIINCLENSGTLADL